MKRTRALLIALVSVGSTACGEPVVVTEALLTGQGGQPAPIADMPVRLLPYDRQALLDSLTEAAGQPEPTPSPELLEQRRQAEQARQEWQQAEARARSLADSIRIVAAELKGLEQQRGQGTPAHDRASRRFGRLESELGEVKQRQAAAQARFNQLRGATAARLDSLRAAREAWAARAFRNLDQIVQARLEAAERGEVTDTTSADGTALFRVPQGRWWVSARYALPHEELHWSLPVEVTGDSTHVRLTEQNARKRPVF